VVKRGTPFCLWERCGFVTSLHEAGVGEVVGKEKVIALLKHGIAHLLKN